MMNKKTKLGSEYQLVSSSEEYFDDCPICRAMKKAAEEGREPTGEELEEAFAKAEVQN